MYFVMRLLSKRPNSGKMQAHKTKTKKATEQFQTKLNWFTAQLFHEADSGKKKKMHFTTTSGIYFFWTVLLTEVPLIMPNVIYCHVLTNIR